MWESRTHPLSPERLALGHPREKACSLFHAGIALWLKEDLRAATVLLEALFATEVLLEALFTTLTSPNPQVSEPES